MHVVMYIHISRKFHKFHIFYAVTLPPYIAVKCNRLTKYSPPAIGGGDKQITSLIIEYVVCLYWIHLKPDLPILILNLSVTCD